MGSLAQTTMRASNRPSDPRGPIGVGFTPSLDHLDLLREVRHLLDYVVVHPHIFCRDRALGSKVSRVLQQDLVFRMRDAAGDLPVVVHGQGLSIGSVMGFERSYVEVLDRLATCWPFLWHSEHLGFLPQGERESFGPGTPLPLPCSRGTVTLVAPRAAALQARYGVPFLLENTVRYLDEQPGESDWDEAVLLEEVAASSGCGLLLDLYSIYCNERNHRVDAATMLRRMDLCAVMEVQVAGGPSHQGFQLDLPTSTVSDPVLRLMREMLSQAPNLGAVTFELQAEGQDLLGVRGVRGELLRIREAIRAAQCVS